MESFTQWVKEYITHTARSPFAGTEVSSLLVRMLEGEPAEDDQIRHFYQSFHWAFDDALQVLCCRPIEIEMEHARVILRDTLRTRSRRVRIPILRSGGGADQPDPVRGGQICRNG